MKKLKRIWNYFLNRMLNYENGQYNHITHFYDKGLISLSLSDYKSLTSLQRNVFIWINNECMRFRNDNKAFLVF